MPTSKKPRTKSGATAPLRASRVLKPKAKRPDPRDIGTARVRSRPSGGRPPRFPGRTGGR